MTFHITEVVRLGSQKAQKVRAVRAAAGVPGRVDAAPVRAHVQWLWEIGFGDVSIAAAAGISHGTVHLLRKGTASSIQFEHAARLMGVTHRPVEAQRGTWIAAVGTARRVEALRASGYSYAQIGAGLGVAKDSVRGYAMRRRVTWKSWSAVSVLFEDWSATPGASHRSAELAAEAWLPMEWHGFDIDDPRVEPPRARRTTNELAAVEPLDAETRRKEVLLLTARGLSARKIAERLDVTQRTVERDRGRLVS